MSKGKKIFIFSGARGGSQLQPGELVLKDESTVQNLPAPFRKGDLYKVTDSGVTDNKFIDGAGKPINAGDILVVDEEIVDPIQPALSITKKEMFYVDGNACSLSDRFIIEGTGIYHLIEDTDNFFGIVYTEDLQTGYKGTIVFADNEITESGNVNQIIKYNDTKLFAACDNGLFEIAINNQTHTYSYTQKIAYKMQSVIKLANGNIIAGSGNDNSGDQGIWLSTDDGDTFLQVENDGNRYSKFIEANGVVIAVPGKSHRYPKYSTNGGNSWNSLGFTDESEVSLPYDAVYDAAKDSLFIVDGNIWVITGLTSEPEIELVEESILYTLICRNSRGVYAMGNEILSMITSDGITHMQIPEQFNPLGYYVNSKNNIIVFTSTKTYDIEPVNNSLVEINQSSYAPKGTDNLYGSYDGGAKAAYTTRIDIESVQYKESSRVPKYDFFIRNQIPPAPTENGTYTLKVTVTNGTPVYSWV